jgi:LPS-assembly lipoprotein
MSLFDRRMLLGSLFALGGCGFRPLYGGGTTDGPGQMLGKVRIDAGRGELPFRLREALIENLRPAAPGAPLVLKVEADVTRDGLLIEDDDQITRYNLTLDVDYTLRRADAPAPLYTGEARSIAAYNATASQYATLVSEREVQARAAEDVAEKIARRLAAAFDPVWLG